MRIATLSVFFVSADERLTVFLELEVSCRLRMSVAGHFNFVTAISALSSEISL